MLISYNWLKDYIHLDDVSPEQLAERLTRGGIEVEFIHSLNKGVSDIVVGHIEDCWQHPNADRLRVCKVNIGEKEPVQIVCGASNVAKDQYVIVAKVGAQLPGDFHIKKTKLRGELSEGMICSLDELGVDTALIGKESADGIYVINEPVAAGNDAISLLNLDDYILELDLTPNRADCLNMIGVAYEVGALYDVEVNKPSISVKESNEEASEYIDVTVQCPKENPYYGATIIKDVKVGPSPTWLQNRLIAAGIRPISNIVDITNYVLLEYGQPLHAFDYDRFGSKEVVVRFAHENEKIVTLDDEERTLTKDHLVITNGKEPVALAGVMGGASSEVQADTTTVLLEAAYFDSGTVRTSSSTIGLRTDASVRYERGIDRSRVREAARRAASLIEKIAGGKVLHGVVEVDHLDMTPKTVRLHLDRMNDRLGMNISMDKVKQFMDQLRFDYEAKGDVLHVTVPPRRLDITIEEDLMEEVARLYGYDHIPTTLPIGATTPGTLTEYQQKRRRVRQMLERAGLYQVVTYSLTSPNNTSGHTVKLAMPMSEERSTMRTSLIPHLFDVLRYNLNRRNENIHIYEVGSIFITEEEKVTKQPIEREMVAGAFTGNWHEHKWQGEKKLVDFYVVKGVLEQLFTELGVINQIQFEQAEIAQLHPGRTARITLAGEELGFIGQVHPVVERENDLRETYVFQINMEQLLTYKTDPILHERLPRYPAIVRDIALVVDATRSAKEIETIITEAGGDLLKRVHLFDLYEGDHMEEGKKSVAFSLTYIDPNRTLTDKEVQRVHDEVVLQLEQQIDARLRE